MTAAAYIVLSLYLYNRYTAAVLFPLTIVFLGISIYFFAPAEWRIDAVKWLEWLLDYTFGVSFIQARYSLPSAWLIVSVLSLVLYIFTISIEWFTVPLIISAGIIGIEWSLGHTQILPICGPLH